MITEAQAQRLKEGQIVYYDYLCGRGKTPRLLEFRVVQEYEDSPAWPGKWSVWASPSWKRGSTAPGYQQSIRTETCQHYYLEPTKDESHA